ncbi:MAG: oligopeptide transporter, OPT family [Leptospiraceae bacterium]|nr:oligopeptide transporter, OPT family [Leptospiraceae bacterium]
MAGNEFTFRAVLIGLLLSVILGAANTYLGLYAGLTVSASIPAAVISMFLLRKVLRKGSILENNIVQSMASAGESLAAGVIFTIPALVITKNWHDFQFWPTTTVALCGGLLGVVFLIPFRRSFISGQSSPELQQDLIYPEGHACAEVLRTGDRPGKAWSILAGMGTGLIFKAMASLLFKAGAHIAVPLGSGGRRVAYMGLDFSAALVGVGFIVGLRIAFLVFLGGLITWAIILPLFGPINPATSIEQQVFAFWSSEGRFAGVGAMIIGTVESLLLASSALKSLNLRSLFFRKSSLPETGQSETGEHLWNSQPPEPSSVQTDNDHSSQMDTDSSVSGHESAEQDIPGSIVITLLAFVVLLSGFLVVDLNGWGALPLVAWVLVLSLPVVSVASYLVGLVGSSNSPVSGITLSVLLLTGLLLVPFVSGAEAVLSLLLVAGIICCSAATAGDIAQDLKTGSLIGANPARQQWAEILGIVVAAPVFALVLQLLHETYGIGDNGLLKAPQATLFASLAQSMFSDAELPLPMIGLGALLGALLFLWNRYGKFRIPIMPVAVGMYLPLSVSAPLLLGGILHRLFQWRDIRKGPAVHSDSTRSGPADQHGSLEPAATTRIAAGSILSFFRRHWPSDPLLYSSGLIAGEAISGILVALWLLYAGADTLSEWPVAGFLLFLLVIAPLIPLPGKNRSSAKGQQ